MSLDTTNLTAAVTDTLQMLFDYLPLGVAVFGTIGAVVGGLLFGKQLVGTVVSSITKLGGGS